MPRNITMVIQHIFRPVTNHNVEPCNWLVVTGGSTYGYTHRHTTTTENQTWGLNHLHRLNAEKLSYAPEIKRRKIVFFILWGWIARCGCCCLFIWKLTWTMKCWNIIAMSKGRTVSCIWITNFTPLDNKPSTVVFGVVVVGFIHGKDNKIYPVAVKNTIWPCQMKTKSNLKVYRHNRCYTHWALRTRRRRSQPMWQ